jgi:cell division protein FtsL
MFNKKQVIVFLMLAFSAGYIVSDLAGSLPLKAEVTNIVAQTLDAKITTQARRISALEAQVVKLQSETSGDNSKIERLALSVKALSKAVDQGLSGVPTKEEFKTLKDRVKALEAKS